MKSALKNQSACGVEAQEEISEFLLLQIIYILFVGENTVSTDDIKNAPSNSKIKSGKAGRNRFRSSPGKGAHRSQNLMQSQGEHFFPNPPPGRSKNVILCFFIANMIYSTQYTSVYPLVKKIQSNSSKKSISQSACMNAEIEP